MKRTDASDIKRLKKRVELNREERDRHQKLVRWLEEREKEIKIAKERVMTSFFCDTCDADWDGVGFKQIRVPKGSMWFAYYIGYCPAGHPCVRRITDKLNDPYFYRSYILKKEQAKHADDFLPHWHPRFKLVYPEAYAKLIARGDISL